MTVSMTAVTESVFTKTQNLPHNYFSVNTIPNFKRTEQMV